MIQLENRTVDEYGQVSFKIKDLYPLIMKGYEIQKLLIEDGEEYQQFVQVAKAHDQDEMLPPVYSKPEIPVDDLMTAYRNEWLIPERFKHLDLRVWLEQFCETQQQKDRIHAELDVFEKYDLFGMLRSLVYLIETFRKHKVLWGIGRGSSVSSYVLFLIGVHRVDSLAYDLDFSEFLN